MKGAEFWLKLEVFPPLKVEACYFFIFLFFLCWRVNVVDRRPSAYQMWLPLFFMFLPAHSASQHSSMFSSICLLSIDQPSRASVCLTSATSSSSSGNYLAALHRLLIFMSTCRNICFGMSFVNANQLPCWAPRLVHFHSLSQRGFAP